ncbi:hypothetical protein [Cryptosporangium sp. NPDC048952]|uniref:hypothetical protein n=1 Tax=Cryptosporangium sp. NPDC048952 TaxID=3363961 RepID=UPI003713BF44
MTIAPVGHLQGRISSSVRVRLGTATVELDELEYATWLLAHGLDDLGPRLLPAEVLSTLVDDVAPLDRLWDRGLLVEVPEDPAAFANEYRLVPLVHGLGNARRSASFGIGLPGERMGRLAELSGAWAELNPAGFEVWRRSAVYGSLASTVAAVVSGDSPLREGLAGVEEGALREHAVSLLGPLITGWTAALQPASPTPLVGAPSFPPPPETDRAGWLFAAGHSGGPFHRFLDSAYVAHLVRVGAEDHSLDEGEARIWEITRAATRDRLWNRASVAAAAVGEGVPDAGRRLDALIERGLVVEVHPGTERALAFARAYRLQPLLHGLAERTDLFEYGLPGRPRVAVSTDRTALLWRTAGQWPSLWDAVTAVSASYAEVGQDRFREDTPEEYLTHWGFAIVRELLAAGVVYLDGAV